MRLLATIIFIHFLHYAFAQEKSRRIGFDLGLAPLYVHSDQVVDNWLGGKPAFATTLTGAINWNFKDSPNSIGVGGGVSLWGNRMLHPVYFKLNGYLMDWCEECFKNEAFWRRVHMNMQIGTVLGRPETWDGPLRPDLMSYVNLGYRIGPLVHHRLHVGIFMGIFSFRGPYSVLIDQEWRKQKLLFTTIGPSLWLAF